MSGDRRLNMAVYDKLKNYITFRKPKKNPRASEEMACFGYMTHDNFQLIRGLMKFSVEMFRVLMACMLSVVVPQKCPPSDDIKIAHTCTFEENIHDLTNFNKFVLTWNFITLGFSILHYVVVSRREAFLIKYLDEDDNKPDEYLPTIIDKYPDIESNLMSINRVVLISATVTLIFFIVNAIASAYLVFHDYYNGFQTGTVFATNVGLIITVIEKALFHAWAGVQKKVALSCIDFEPISYNVIDPDYDVPFDPDAPTSQSLLTPELDVTAAYGSTATVDAPPAAAYNTDRPSQDIGYGHRDSSV